HPFTGSTLKFICCSLLVFSGSVVYGAPPKAKEGVLDIHSVDLSRNRVALSGAWGFFEDELVLRAHVFAGRAMRYIEFPQTWNKGRTSESGVGYATYGLKVIVSNDEKSLALEFPQIYSSYILWVNGNVVAQNGRVGTTMSEVVPQWM